MFPPREVIGAFNAFGEPQPLPGGQASTYLVDKTVFKKVDNKIETLWIIDTLGSIHQRAFRVPRYLKATTGEFIVDGWIVAGLPTSSCLEGI